MASEMIAQVVNTEKAAEERQQAEKDASEIINKAKLNAEKIIENAKLESSRLLKQSEADNQKAEEEIISEKLSLTCALLDKTAQETEEDGIRAIPDIIEFVTK